MAPYFDYVRSLCTTFPRLQLLADFMSDQIWISEFQFPKDVERRMKKIDVITIDLGPSSQVTKRFTNLCTLEDHLESQQEPGTNRIILVEDISRDVIELLGSKFPDLDPRFFENHVRDIHRFLPGQWMGDRTARLECSLARVLKRNFFTISFSRPYQFNGWESLYSSRLKLNVPRIGSVAHNFYLREKASVYGPLVRGDNSICTYHCSTSEML